MIKPNLKTEFSFAIFIKHVTVCCFAGKCEPRPLLGEHKSQPSKKAPEKSFVTERFRDYKTEIHMLPQQYRFNVKNGMLTIRKKKAYETFKKWNGNVMSGRYLDPR